MEVPFRGEIEKIDGGEYLVKALQRLFEGLQQSPFRVGGARLWTGQGSPETVVAGDVGDLYLRTDVVTSFSANPAVRANALYVKLLGARPTIGWYPIVNMGLSGLPNFQVPYSNGTPVLQSSANFTFDGSATLNADTLLVANTATAANFTTAVGYTFPAVQSPSGGANVLDDYEEGSWTPALGGTTSESGQAYSAQQGSYVKIGQFVHCRGRVTLTTLGTITGSAVIKGLPFVVEAITGGGSVGLANGLTTAVVSLVGFTVASTSYMQLGMRTAAAVNVSAMVQADFSNTTDLTFDIPYRTTA